MKTEQEQIEKMARSMCGYCSTDGKCSVSKNGREPDICANVDTQHCLYKEYAERLIESGYGNVTEYKTEIKRLRQEVRDTDKMARNTIEQYRAENEELENTLKQSEDNYSRAFERLKAQEREIERLRTTLGQCNTELNSALESLKSQCREIGELKAEVKQAKIDALNELKKKTHNYYPSIDSYCVSQHIVLVRDINELIKEIENE